LLLLVCSF